MVEKAEWLIRKGGYFYRPNCQGYTTHKHEAGRYTKEKAEKEAFIEPWHMKAIHESEWPDDAVSLNYKDKDARIAALEAQLAEAKAEIERLREVIKPFADEANNWDGFEAEEHLVESFPGLPETSSLQVFHLRAARDALEGGKSDA